MSTHTKASIRFLLGAACVAAAIVGAFCRLPWFYFAVLFAGGCGLMGQTTLWEKIALVVKGRNGEP